MSNQFSFESGSPYALQAIPILEDVIKVGQTVRLAVKAFDPTTGKPTTITAPQIIVYDPDDVIQAGPTSPSQNSSLTNEYFFFFAVPSNGTKGTWRSEWTGTVTGRNVFKTIKFEVL